MFNKLGFLCLILLSVTVQAQELRFSGVVKESPVVIVGEIMEPLNLIDYEEKQKSRRAAEEGKTISPSTRLGYLYQIKIIETVKPRTSQKDPKFAHGSIIRMFTPYTSSTHIPYLASGKKYLLFLRPFDSKDQQLTDEQLANMALFRNGADLERKTPFDLKETFAFAKTWDPAIELTKENSAKLLDEVRRAAIKK